MGAISRRVLLCTVLGYGCRSAPEPAPAPVPKASSEAQGEPAQAEPSGAEPRAAEPSAAEPPPEARPKAQAPRIYDEQTQEITAHIGERFEVALPGNITTPLKWTLDPASMSDLVTLSAQSYSDAPPPECQGCVGYPGTAHFVLDAAQDGATTLRFAYRKLGQKSGQAKREVAIKLTVTP